MKRTSLAVFISMLTLAGATYAQSQSPSTEIRESTDPDRAAQVEQRASEIQARQQASEQMTSGDSGTTTKKAGKRSKSKKMSKSGKAGTSGASDNTSGSSPASDAASGSAGGNASGQGAGASSK